VAPSGLFVHILSFQKVNRKGRYMVRVVHRIVPKSELMDALQILELNSHLELDYSLHFEAAECSE
jgi:hypothetical protein